MLALQQFPQRRGPDAAATEPLREPVADEAPAVLPPSDDVSDDLSADRDGLDVPGGVGEHLARQCVRKRSRSPRWT